MDSRLPLSVQTDSLLQLGKNVWSDESNGLNFVYSPFSIYVALGLLTSGSNGGTLKQLLQFLKADSLDHLNSVGSQLIESVTGGTGINEGVGGPKLSFISGMWIENSCTLKPLFKEIVNSIYRGEAEAVDFKTKANEVKEKVNKWVEKETKGLIKDLLPPGSINQDTRLVLANALYFKGEWNQDQFDPTRTEKSEFHLLNGVGSVEVLFMTSNKEQLVSCFDGFSVLQLPYKQAANSDYSHQSQFSMYIFLPDERDGLGNLIQKASSDSGFLDRHIPIWKVKMGEFRIPKFKISFGFEASNVLKTLGVVSPFDPDEAELDEMVVDQVLPGNCRGLYVSSIHHKCFVEIDEVGTKAAAVTAAAVSFVFCSGVDFVADHPFMFFIRDDQTGVVLFMGHILNPL